MGLAVEVGYLADMLAHDAEGAAEAMADLEAINDALATQGLPTHTEPTEVAVWSADMLSYSGLLALREVAAMLWAGRPIPRDRMIEGDDTQASDTLVSAFLENLAGSAELTLVGRAFRALFRGSEPPARPPFLHLTLHSDHDGYYVPVPLDVPLVPKRVTEDTEHLWPLGSTLGLEADINEMCAALSLPVDMGHDDAALARHLDSPAPDGLLWQAQPCAAHACLVLREACFRSLSTGAAIRFC